MFAKRGPEDEVAALGAVVVDVGNTYVVSKVLGTADVVGVLEDEAVAFVIVAKALSSESFEVPVNVKTALSLGVPIERLSAFT